MKKLLFIGCWILLVVASVHPIRAEENVITVAATEWSPYMSEQLPNNGVVAEITRVAFEKAGYKAVFKFYPWKRLLASAEDGAVDAAMGVSYTEERTAYFLYSVQTTFEDPKVIYYNKHENVIETFSGDLHDLCPSTIGVLSGSYLEGLLNQVDCLALDAAGTVELNLKKLLKARFPYLLESQTSIQFLLSTQMFSEAERNSIAFYETPVEIDKNYTVFSKKAVQQKPFLQAAFTAFDASLARIKADGTYAGILRDYGM